MYRRRQTIKSLLQSQTLLLVVAIGLAVFGSSGAIAQDFSAGYRAESSLPSGVIVSLISQDTGEVAPTDSTNIDRVLGVVVGGSSSLLMISSEETNVQVVTSGLTNVLVTDVAGDIKNGDYITASSVSGIGKRAGREDGKVIGVAKADFADATIQTVETASGDVREITVARIPVLIQVGGNPESLYQESFLPGFIQEGANTLAGEPVAPARIIIALIIITGGMVGSMVLLYGAVSSTIISIGRNPLSDSSIYSGLIRMVAIALGIIIFSVGLAYVVVTGW